MIVDTSALIALLFDEPPADVLEEKLFVEKLPKMSAPNLLEAMVVVGGKGDATLDRWLDQLVQLARIQVTAFGPEHLALARQAFRDFGKGSGHPARLNFGDCIAYALAAETGEPLLCVGEDFHHTGIEIA